MLARIELEINNLSDRSHDSVDLTPAETLPRFATKHEECQRRPNLLELLPGARWSEKSRIISEEWLSVATDVLARFYVY